MLKTAPLWKPWDSESPSTTSRWRGRPCGWARRRDRAWGRRRGRAGPRRRAWRPRRVFRGERARRARRGLCADHLGGGARCQRAEATLTPYACRAGPARSSPGKRTVTRRRRACPASARLRTTARAKRQSRVTGIRMAATVRAPRTTATLSGAVAAGRASAGLLRAEATGDGDPHTPVGQPPRRDERLAPAEAGGDVVGTGAATRSTGASIGTVSGVASPSAGGAAGGTVVRFLRRGNGRRGLGRRRARRCRRRPRRRPGSE